MDEQREFMAALGRPERVRAIIEALGELVDDVTAVDVTIVVHRAGRKPLHAKISAMPEPFHA